MSKLCVRFRFLSMLKHQLFDIDRHCAFSALFNPNKSHYTDGPPLVKNMFKLIYMLLERCPFRQTTTGHGCLYLFSFLVARSILCKYSAMRLTLLFLSILTCSRCDLNLAARVTSLFITSHWLISDSGDKISSGQWTIYYDQKAMHKRWGGLY